MRFESGTALVLLVTLGLLTPLGAQDPDPKAPQPAPEASEPARQGDQRIITEGKVPVLEFLKFIQVVTDKPVLYPSTTGDRNFDPAATIEVLDDIEPFTLALARKMLDTNGYRTAEETLEDGRVVIRVWHESSPSTGLDGVTPIIEAHELERLMRERAERRARQGKQPGAATPRAPPVPVAVADLVLLLMALDEQPTVHPFQGRETPTVRLLERPTALTAEVIAAVLEAAGVSSRELTLADGRRTRFLAEPPIVNPFGAEATVMIVELEHQEAQVTAHALRTQLASVGDELGIEAFILLTPTDRTLVLGGSAATLRALRKLITELDGES